MSVIWVSIVFSDYDTTPWSVYFGNIWLNRSLVPHGINLFIKFTKLISSRLFPHTNSLAHWLFIDQYLECISMWNSRLHVIIGEHHIGFYYKKIRQCFIDNFKLEKRKKEKKRKEMKIK